MGKKRCKQRKSLDSYKIKKIKKVSERTTDIKEKYSYMNSNIISFSNKEKTFQCTSHFPKSDLKETDYDYKFLNSAYYKSERDMHKVFFENKFAGVIIPVAFLSESDNSIIENEDSDFKMYADLAIRKILSSDIIKNVNEPTFSIEDLFPSENTLAILLYEKKAIKGNRCLEGYIPALYDAGYCCVENPQVLLPLYCSELRQQEIDERRLKRTIKIKLFYNIDEQNNSMFYKELFQSILPYNENPLFRYILLYQIVEIFSSYSSYNLYISCNERYCKNTISKNDLREELNKSTNDKHLIRYIYKEINSQGGFYENFSTAVKSLFERISYDGKSLKNYGEYMYAMRNRIVHDARSLTSQMSMMKEIVNLYERTTIMLLRDCEKLQMSSKKVRVD